MLHIWLCTDRKKNTQKVFSLIREKYELCLSEQILMVPEQFSHMTQEQFCRSEGDSASRMAQVLDFTRLAELVFSQEGGLADTETNGAGRLLMMSLAVEQVRSRLKIYGNSGAKPEFLLQLLSMLDEFRSFCVTPSSLRLASSQTQGVLAQKAEEFALLMESYDAVCENCGQNPLSRLSRLWDCLQESDFPKGKCFYFDGFTDFNGIQLEIISELLSKADELHVFLQCGTLDGTQQQFDTARDTGKKLLRLSRKCEIPHELHFVSSQEDNAFSYLRGRLFSGTSRPFSDGDKDAVVFIKGADILSQCRIAAGQMLRLVSQGVRWREIAVACADFESYRPVMESVFRRAQIPAYFAGDTDILKQPLVHMLISALDAACSGFEQEPVLAYIKSAFSPLSRERSDRLENYVLLWNISGKRMKEPWTMHPSGLGNDLSEEEDNRRKQLEEDRCLAIMPLVRLHDGFKNAKNTGDMVLALYAFMQEISLQERLQQMADRCFEKEEFQKAQEYVQLYGIICELLEQLYGVLGKSLRAAEDFFAIFRAALSQCSVGTIPASLDCLSVGDLSSQRRSDCKYLFLMGLNEGCFPVASSNRSLLTDMERSSLMELGIGVSPTAAARLERELAAIDSVLSAVQSRLYLSATEGKESYFYRRIGSLFPHAPCICDDEELISRSHRDYLSYLSGRKIDDLCKESLQQEARQLARAKDYRPEDLSPSEVTALYGKTLRLSSSKIDALASCRFAYFLNYGLKARERRSAEEDTTFYGTFVHYVLEKTTKQVMAEGGFKKVSIARTLQIANSVMERYTAEELKDLWQSERAEYLFRRNFAEVDMVIRDLHDELSNSEFEPKWFELHFARDGDLPEIKITGEKMNAVLEGYVDRADILQRGDRIYVRVIDYKTGKKSFEYTKVFYGLSLQMLLYLFALQKNGEGLLQKKLTPAGVLYFPARVQSIRINDKSDSKDIEKSRRAAQKRSGLLLDSEPVLYAMEPYREKGPVYLPYDLDKKGQRRGDLADLEQLARLSRFVFQKVGELGDKLYGGEITPDPYYLDQNNNACVWCPYKTVCREHKEERRLDAIKNAEEFWDRIQEVTGENG